MICDEEQQQSSQVASDSFTVASTISRGLYPLLIKDHQIDLTVRL